MSMLSVAPLRLPTCFSFKSLNYWQGIFNFSLKRQDSSKSETSENVNLLHAIIKDRRNALTLTKMTKNDV